MGKYFNPNIVWRKNITSLKLTFTNNDAEEVLTENSIIMLEQNAPGSGTSMPREANLPTANLNLTFWKP